MYYMKRDVVTNLMHGQNTKGIKALCYAMQCFIHSVLQQLKYSVSV